MNRIYEMKEIAGVKLYDVEDLQKLLELSGSAIRRYLRSGRLIGQKIGKNYYVSEDNLQEFLNPQVTTPVKQGTKADKS